MANTYDVMLCFDIEELFVELGIYIEWRFIIFEKLGMGRILHIILSSK